jgi:hypothetical protein
VSKHGVAKMKKLYLFLGLSVLFLLANTVFVSGRNDMSSKEIPTFAELIENENLNDISLTIYYMNLFRLTRAPVRLSDLINRWHDYKVVVTGDDLLEYKDLLSRLINTELIPVKNESFVNARLYYVFTHEEYGELFSFLVYGGGDVMFVNGREVEHDAVFYDIVIPFLPEDAVKTIERYLNNLNKSSAESSNKHQEQLQSIVEKIFDINMENRVISANIEIVNSFGFDILYAKLLIPADDKHLLFYNYTHLERLAIDDGVHSFPSSILSRFPHGFELDYYHAVYRDVIMQESIHESITDTQEKHIAFSQEVQGNIIVILRASHPAWEIPG